MSEDKKEPSLPIIQNESPYTAANREKKEMVSLGGFATTEAGKLTRSNYFRFIDYNLHDYSDIQLSDTQARKISTHLRKLSTGSTAMVPMYCAAGDCPVAAFCPLVQMRNSEDPDERGHPYHGQAPLMRQCIIETQLLKEWIMRYFDEYEVDPDNFTEVGYINELAELQLLEMRINMNLAKPENASLMIDQTMSISNDGTPIVQKQIHPLFEQKEKISNRRQKIIKLMVGDRQEKYKKEAALKVREDKDPSSKMAEMASRLEKLRMDMNKVSSPEAIEASNKQGYISPSDIIGSDDD